ncbi:protein tramtrack, beta isoform-like isoform X2 [Homalodisca vitripennis]|uniref:protein tramtrack, beta isoform-like isoform X2 n=1 Tax=Homalodisca vitripennis TaxID=197043 RepID=UPI001EEC06B6|nr:protein tramtrack, beta isoform-like isoform X2 [Homalodisca vitripennis]
MATSQRFCLRWNNHQSNLLSVFDQLLHDEAFVDVTLAVEGQFLRAHKMVLSACSPYFQSLFVGHPDRHPIVILKDVPYADMRSLLDFMYRGEVSVDQERLTAFLKVAESLRIKGLTEVNEERCDLPSIASSLLSTPPSAPPPPNLHRIHPLSHKRVLPPMAANPLLGSALTAPKRKRGRPRKLSGSSNGPNTPGEEDNTEQEMRLHHPNRADSPAMVGPPDLLEVNMGDSDHNPLQNDESGMEADDTDGKLDNSEAEEIEEKPIKQEPTPGTSSHDSSFKGSNSQDGDTFNPEEETVLRLNLCDDVSISTEPRSEPGQVPTEIIITPVAADPHDSNLTPVQSLFASGVHFLSHDSLALLVPKQEPLDEPEESSTEVVHGRRDLLEYLIQEDGSVVCKWCGEVLPSRTHWYRHKYKFHVQSPPGTASLFKCYRCNVFFKSRKGYHGHITSRHSGIEKKPNFREENESVIKSGFKELEMNPPRGRRSVKPNDGIPVEDYEKQREKEEKLVAAIIEKVKKECEAQGSTVTRRGYTRRQTVMNT